MTDKQEASTDIAPEAAPAQPQEQPSKGPTVNFPKLLDLCGGVLGRLFFKLPKDKSKALFMDIKKGGNPELGEVTLGESLKLTLKLELEYREFVGPGFNFDVFRNALQNLLGRIASTLKIKADLNLRTSQQGGVLVGFAGLTKVGEQHNALMMALELGTAGEVRIRLMFVDPSQFEIE